MKKTIYVIILLASGFILYRIWANCNAARGLNEVQDQENQLFDSNENKTQNDTAVKPKIAKIRRDIAGDKFIRVTPEYKAVFEDFLKGWGNQPLAATTINAYRPRLEAQAQAYGHIKGNQGLALFLDWAIWMFSIWLALFSKVLRDITGDTSKIPKGEDPPFSLGRTQLLAWITIIASVYVYAVLWDGRTPDINQTALILMGISSATCAAGVIIDTTEIQQGVPRTQDQPSSGNFFQDILSDATGVSIYRIQNFIWTLVAIVVYFYRYANPPANVPVDHPAVLPDLDSTLLALTGISSLTYLTLKTRENPNPIPLVKITLGLAPTNSLPQAEKDALTKGGFPGATVTITDPSSVATKITPDPASPNFNFNATNLVAGSWTVVVSWTGVTVPGTTRTLNLTWTGQVTAATNTLLFNFP